jgi:glycosyltransferase involved in cell wall biosynthesis
VPECPIFDCRARRGQRGGLYSSTVAKVLLVACALSRVYLNARALYMAAADIFCLPSYREGFGSAVLEAAACSVPAVATRIYGLTDAVEEGVTGILVPPRNALALAEALIQLLNDNVLRQKMGESARLRVLLNFSRDYIVSSLALYIHNILNSPNYRNNHLK